MKRLTVAKPLTRVAKITINHVVDEYPDISHLGHFSDTPGRFAIELGDGSDRTYRYFNAKNVADMTEARQNYERVQQFNSGALVYYGIIARAEILSLAGTDDLGRLSEVIRYVSSGGLWGIESDSDEKYIHGIEQERIAELRDILKKRGFSRNQFENAPVVKVAEP
jgi:hypothetical protein